MGTPTQTYVDPSIAADSGAGTVGDPYGDLQYALNTITRDSTNGDQINIKAGTDEILASALDLTSYGSPSIAAPLILRGYTSAANDGGIGGISGNGSVGVWASTAYDHIIMVDLHMHNTGAATVVQLDEMATFVNCELDNTTGSAIDMDAWAYVKNCYIHNIGNYGVDCGQQGWIISNFFENGTNDFTAAVYGGSNMVVLNNVIDIDGASEGCTTNNSRWLIANNSIYASSGTGSGINVGSNDAGGRVINNIVEGFSGVGGIGVELNVTGADLFLYGHNKFYNNTTNESLGSDVFVDLGNNSALGASPFADAANNDFTVDTTVRAGAYPSTFTQEATNTQYLDIGALQRKEPQGTLRVKIE